MASSHNFKRQTQVLGHNTTAVNLHLNSNGLLIISNSDNDVLIGGKITFAWALAIQAEMKTHKELRIIMKS